MELEEGSGDAKAPAIKVTEWILGERWAQHVCALREKDHEKGEVKNTSRGWGEEAPGPSDVTPVG